MSFLKGQEEIPIDEEEKKIKFSIVITNRNNESSLERAICSALEQDYADIELICVDDASTDRSREIIKSFENKENFIPIYLEENSGSSCSRLFALKGQRRLSSIFRQRGMLMRTAAAPWPKC